MNTQSYDSGIIAVRQIVAPPVSQSGIGAVEISPKFLAGHSTHPTVHTHDVSVNPLPAAEFVNSEILNTGAAGGVVLTMPTAAAVITAFLAAGIILGSGDCFTVKVTNVVVGQTITFTPSASVTTMSGAANFVVSALKSAIVTFRVVNAVVGAQAIEFSGMLSN